MQHLFSDTTQAWETIEQNSNTVVFSSLSEFYQPVQSNGFAIKYVVEGTERYTLNEQRYHVNEGSYILCNSTKEGHVEIESRNKVKGICINIVPELILQAVASIKQPDTSFPDPALAQFFSSAGFIESQYKADKTRLGKTLLEIGLSVQKNCFSKDDLSIEFFYSLAEKLIADQLPVFHQLQKLPGIKAATKKELHKRISRGIDYIDAAYSSSLSIEKVAKEACMSEYHFFRLFKKMVGVSPHQYILQKRLESGKKLLESGGYSVTDTAVECGYSDVYSFSKAFKNHFGIAPSSLVKK